MRESDLNPENNKIEDPTSYLRGLLAGAREPQHLSEMQARQFCPGARITNQFEPGMETFKVHADSLQKFLRQNIDVIYINPASKSSNYGEAMMVDCTHIQITCRINYFG